MSRTNSTHGWPFGAECTIAAAKRSGSHTRCLKTPHSALIPFADNGYNGSFSLRLAPFRLFIGERDKPQRAPQPFLRLCRLLVTNFADLRNVAELRAIVGGHQKPAISLNTKPAHSSEMKLGIIQAGFHCLPPKSRGRDDWNGRAFSRIRSLGYLDTT